MDEYLGILSESVKQGAILSTCNRTELYVTVDEPHVGTRGVRHFLCEASGLMPEDLAPHLYVYSQREAVSHLFKVASGLDSMILGETEVLGQVKTALDAAEASGAAGPELSRLLRRAVSIGREVRDKTGISRHRVSVSSAGVELAKQHFGGDLSGKRILVISAGEAGKLAAKALADCGASEIVVTSRTHEKASSLAKQLSGRSVPFSELPQALVETDIVITATGAPRFILRRKAVADAMKQRPERPLLIIDIAVPRDVDPKVGDVTDVSLYDIDDLKAVSQASLKEREKESTKAKALIERETDKFMNWWGSLGAVPTLNVLRERAEEVRIGELDKAMAKLKNLTDEERQAVDILTKSLMNKYLHHPMMALKEFGHDPERLDVMRQMMGICDGSAMWATQVSAAQHR
jgi:glutamyl-tRNA reductase